MCLVCGYKHDASYWKRLMNETISGKLVAVNAHLRISNVSLLGAHSASYADVASRFTACKYHKNFTWTECVQVHEVPEIRCSIFKQRVHLQALQQVCA